MTTITGALHKEQFKYVIISFWVLIGIRNLYDIFIENSKIIIEIE
jgi:hypothetical protein